MTDELAFEAFPKIARLSREIVVTEKIDGTNAQVNIQPRGSFTDTELAGLSVPPLVEIGDMLIFAGSRSRWLTRQTDNFGFAKWVEEHAQELYGLGIGRHFGEWWGSGIQRGYGLPQGEKRFSLFNSYRWIDTHQSVPEWRMACLVGGKAELAPKCCHVVPMLHTGDFDTTQIKDLLIKLKDDGSAAAPGFMKPEGIIIYHTAARQYFKKTIEKDESPKGKS
jgi:hypothetical protein